MKLAGTLIIGDEEYLFVVDYQKHKEKYYCFSKIRSQDYLRVMSGDLQGLEVLKSVHDLRRENVQEYLIGAISRSKTTGKLSSYGNTNQIQMFLNTLQFCKNYAFDESSIYLNEKQMVDFKHITQFGAEDDRLSYLYIKVDDAYSGIHVRDGAFSAKLQEFKHSLNLSKLQFTAVSVSEQKTIAKAILDKVTYEDLEKALDMSWYKDASGVKKDYRAVCSISDFEEFFGELMNALQQTTGKFYVSLDTETTGINIYNLSKENELRDTCVAISMSWKEDTAWIIYTDMEYVDSLPNSYAFSRLDEIFSPFDGTRMIEYTYRGKQYSCPLCRDKINLIGHNTPFDRRVGTSEGANLWFDDDTLQMAFNINPTTVRGSKKLKMITRILFGHETPELEDVLGKGNEDKYRYLQELEVANLYAGADADYTLKCFFELKDMLGKAMYFRYRQQDMKMLNILSDSEFNGMNTVRDDMLVLAQQVLGNIKILEDAAYSYVGAYMDYQQKVSILYGQHESGLISEDELLSAVENIVIDSDAKYEFKLTGADIRNVIYNILKYPVMCTTETGIPQIDKNARKKWLRVNRKPNSSARKLSRSILKYGCDYAEYERLSQGNEKEQKKANSMLLIDKDKFNEKEYPFALILEQHALYTKEYTAYYKPMYEQNMEGKLFKNYNMARIETRRIMNPGQTVKKDLKRLIVPYSDEYYMLDFDMSQVEYRAMASLAKAQELVDKMKDPEKDYHIETGAMVNNIPAYKVTKDQRKKVKNVSFGKPYGLGLNSLTETMHGEVNEQTRFETSLTIHKWEEANKEIVAYLEANREVALQEVDLSLKQRNFMDAWQKDPETKQYLLDEDGNRIPKPLGAVYNRLGFCRYFDLSNVEQDAKAKARRAAGKFTGPEGVIRRAAGNYPVQSFAAELFRIILCRFYDRCKQEGIADKVKWHMLIHDELLCSVHKSVNPFLIYKIVKEACMISMPGHTKYFVGINIGNNWEECKDDAREAPVLFVERMIKRYEEGDFRDVEWWDNPWEYIKPLREQFVKERILEVVKQVQPDIETAPIDLPHIFEYFDNYTVRAYVNDYPKNGDIPSDTRKEDKDDATYVKKFESWALEVFGEGKAMIDLEGNPYTLAVASATTVEEVYDEFLEDDEDNFLEDDGDYYDYDTGGIIESYYADAEDVIESDLDDIQFDYSKANTCSNVAEMTITSKRYENIKKLSGNLVVALDNNVQMTYLKSILEPSRNGSSTVIFKVGKEPPLRWVRITESTNLFDLDKQITALRQFPKNSTLLGNRLIINSTNPGDTQKIRQAVAENRGNGYVVCEKDAYGLVKVIGNIKANADFRLFE